MLKRVVAYLFLLVAFGLASVYAERVLIPSIALLCPVIYVMLCTAWPPMRKWRLTRAVRMAATVAVAVAVVLWLVSIVSYVRVPYARGRAFALGNGSLIMHSGVDLSGMPLSLHAQWTSISLAPDCWSASAQWRRVTATVYYYAIWPALAALLIPTVSLWFLVRKPIPPGFCAQCGYNLTGNVSGRCPECREPVPTGNRAQ